MKALVLLVLVSLGPTCWGRPTTVVQFSPVGNSPGVAAGFAYAFHAPASANMLPPAPGSGRSLRPPRLAGPSILKTQYHSQDQLGQYAFGYVGEASTAHEIRTSDGAVRGSYTYVDADGQLQTANYIADHKGFRVEATNLPQGPLPDAPAPFLLPQPVQVTPEVAAATAAHLQAVAEVKAARRT